LGLGTGHPRRIDLKKGNAIGPGVVAAARK
jgi:hypothetical protein